MLPELPTGAVQFQDVSKEYRLGYRRAYLREALPLPLPVGRGGNFRALDHVSFDIEPGESFALLGHNGAGKSTALKCLAGVTRPSSGRVSVGGRVSALIELGVGFHPDLTGLDNIRFAAALAGVTGRAADPYIEMACAFAEIDAFLETPVKRYSSGMVARLAFGIAISLPGDVLVVDEVLAVGDASFQRRCHARLKELRREEGRTLLFVSHNEWVVKETCTRAAVLHHGALSFLGDVQPALKHYWALQHHGPERAEEDRGDDALVRVRRATLMPDDRRQYAPDEPVSIQCEITVSASAEQPVLGVCLLNAQAQLLWAVYSYELGLDLPHGSSQVLVEIERLHSLPGPCRLQLFTFDRSHPLVEQVITLEIDVSGDPDSARVERGLVHQEAQMVITPAAPSRD